MLKTCTGNEPQVVHSGQTTGMVRTARKGRFKFASKVLGVLVAQQEVGQGMRVRRDVKLLIVAHASQRASGDVADHIATGLSRGNPDRRQAAHEVWGIVNMDEVELKILARRDMTDGIRILFSKISQGLHLLSGQTPKGNFDALHPGCIPDRLGPLGQLPGGVVQLLDAHAIMALAVVVALAIDPTTQAGLREDPLIDFALTLQFDLCGINVDFFFELRGEVSLQGFFPRKRVWHVRFLYYGYGVALQSPETTKAHPLSVEEVGFDPNSMNNRPRRPSSSTPSCVAATTGATTATAATTQSRKDMGRHGDHHHCTYCVRSH